MKKLVIIMSIIAIAIFGFLINDIIEENREIKRLVYTTLEKESLTDDEKEFISFATNPNEMKESCISLDDEHIQLYEKHFGKN